MKGYSKSNNKKKLTRKSIIGLGEDSIRKNYYPELQESLLHLQKINFRNQALIATIPDVLLVSDSEMNISSFVERTKGDALTTEFLNNPNIMKKLKNTIQRVFAGEGETTCHCALEQAGLVHYYEARLSLSEVNEVIIIIRDITEQKLLEAQLREIADKDALTNLYNRRHFEKVWSEYGGKECSNLAIILLDIDGLKLINDTMGHYAGDQLIIESANIIRAHFGPLGYIAKIGGDEFSVILSGYTALEIEKTLNLFNKSLEKYNGQIRDLEISISYGFSFRQNGIIDTRLMFQESDNNMYQNKLLKTKSNKNYLVKTLMKALEVKDYITEGHVSRIEELASKMGELFGLSNTQIGRIKILAKFHDIGKVGIPDAILKKPSSLTQEEWVIMESHSRIGERIAKELPELNGIAQLILHHHEKWDGSGYPAGIKGEQIPIECRIVSIVDAFDAMTNDRPYRKALTKNDAIREIKEQTGTQFDPALVEIFLLCM